MFLTIWATSQIVRPLRELNTAAQKIAAGDLSVSIAHHSKDEVGTLVESFRQTVKHLEKYIGYINGLAYRDALTGVKNKTAYLEAMADLDEQIRMKQPCFAVSLFDLNNLKFVNDTLGHDFGDMLLIDTCRIICNVFKHSPVYRIGGDEFVVMLENHDLQNYSKLLMHFEEEVAARNQRPNAPSFFQSRVELQSMTGILIFAITMYLNGRRTRCTKTKQR